MLSEQAIKTVTTKFNGKPIEDAIILQCCIASQINVSEMIADEIELSLKCWHIPVPEGTIMGSPSASLRADLYKMIDVIRGVK